MPNPAPAERRGPERRSHGAGPTARRMLTRSVVKGSFMAAPASLAVSKLFYPETEKSKTTIDDIKVEKGQASNVLDAAAQV